VNSRRPRERRARQSERERRVVVTGLGAISPLGLNAEETWRAAVAGRSGVGPITRFDASTFPVRFAAEVKGFAADRYIRSRASRRVLSRPAAFGLAAAEMAWADADFREPPARERVGAVLGSCMDALSVERTEEILRIHGEGIAPERAVSDPLVCLRDASPTGTAQIAAEIGAEGPNVSVYVACASGTQALGIAAGLIRRGEADIILSGGFDSMVTEWDILLFATMGAVSTRNSNPEGASRPFDKSRDGFVMGEGAGILVMEELEHARNRGATVYAELLGYGSSMDAFRITDTPPDGEGAAAAMSRAIEDAGLRPADVQYINAHGTSTPDNDRSETRAIKSVFGDHAYAIPVSSTKSMTGHLIAAAGGLEAVLTLLDVRDGMLPPTINLEDADPDCDLDYVPGRARKASVTVALSNSFGFGGSNAVIVLGRGATDEAVCP
jgi:3-oxoacyl-[acyl-carrier-protein] synthase II